jgi:hypothetical protein
VSNYTLPDMRTDAQADAIADVIRERARQDAKWGDQAGLSSGTWLGILGEEFGEVGKAMIEGGLSDLPPLVRQVTPLTYPLHEKLDQIREELIQVAAVAVAWAEALS